MARAVEYYQFLLDGFDRFHAEGTTMAKPRFMGLIPAAKFSRAMLRKVCRMLSFQQGVVLEFGVYKGGTIRVIAKALLDDRIYGFDSFEDFPDDGRIDWSQGFSVKGLPRTPANVTLLKGFFQTHFLNFVKWQKAIECHPCGIAARSGANSQWR